MSAPVIEQERDEILANLLAELGEQKRQGAVPNLESVCSQHPDLSEELRQLWAAAQFADVFARSSQTANTRPQVTIPAPTKNLPREFGDYELLEELGRGGMGVVYKARQKSLGRVVALKMILRGELATPEDLARFRVEAQAAAHLTHPNIVPVYDAGEVEGQSYFTMRHVEGQTLAAVMGGGPVAPREAAKLLASIAKAVHYAHQRGILHRDLKPSNILLSAPSHQDGTLPTTKPGGNRCNDNIPLVMDFGLAKRVSTGSSGGLTLSGALVGTPAYMAPEQVSGSRGKPSEASDVYSLGVILYEMLTGRPPFQAATAVDTMLLVLDQDPVRPRLLNPTVDPDLELICLKCIQKEPDLRYASAAELANDLEAWSHGERTSLRNAGFRDFTQLFNRIFRDTPHAPVLENWGKLWMAHSVMIFSQCVLTTIMAWNHVDNPFWYLLLWGGGLGLWGIIFWSMRKWAGPVLFVERQVAHAWGGAVAATIGVFIIEILLGLPVLKLAPILAVLAGMTFTVKAGMLSGEFYIPAFALYMTAIPMALWPDYGILLFGIVSGLAFFLMGLKYHLQRLRSRGR